MQERPPVSHLRFWALLVAYLLTNWLIVRFFGWVVRTLELNNSTRTYYREVTETGVGSALGNLFLNWLPQTLLVFLACWVFLRLVRADVGKALAFRVRKKGLWLFPIGMLLLFLYQLLVAPFAGDTPAQDAPAFDRHSLVFIGLYTMRFLPSAMVEEMVFRGSLFFSLEARYGAKVGLVVSVVLFGAAHLYGGWWLFCNALILGAGFTLVYRRTRSLVPVTLLHLFSNLAYAFLNYRG
ncbi:MAG: CPBP family intramembrane glutamic endopeptidase [Planctomycetota bacterium]